MKRIFDIKVWVLFLIILLDMGCSDVLDKENLTAVNPKDVWSNATLARAYMDNIYTALMPGNPMATGNGTDEACTLPDAAGVWLLGNATIDSYNDFGVYSQIRSINFLLDNIDDATFDEGFKNEFKGEALFWRAWSYYRLVKMYGGVPLILTAQEPTSNLEELAMPRNKTSECVAQIIKDLDDATNLLPDIRTGEEVGRIDKGIVLAFKGRVLLFFASPLFNGLGGIATWQEAYEANLEAKNFIEGIGKGLYAPYNKIWDDELNKEIVMVRRFSNPQATYFIGGLIALDFSKNASGWDRPSLNLVDAFPMKDGSKWDSNSMSYDTLWRHRDDRFYTNIYYNGSPNQYAKGMREANTYLWTYYDKINNLHTSAGIDGTHNQITIDQFPSPSSFFRMKAVDKNVNVDEISLAEVDWPEIRFAEVLMNYGECANELGKKQEALEVLYKIRERAGILPGIENKYGISANSTDEIRQAYKTERFVEFCFENKRWDDLRRWKDFDYLRDLPRRKGLAIELKEGETAVEPLSDIEEVYTKFTVTPYFTDSPDIAIKDDYYVVGIPQVVLDRNAKFEQNQNWGGTFNPFQ